MKRRLRYISYHIVGIGIAMGFMLLLLLATLLLRAWPDIGVLALALGATAVFCGILFWCYRWVYLPYKANVKLLELFANGYTLQGVYDLPYFLDPSMEKALLRLRDLVSVNEYIGASKRQAQYLALQNQINPHFLYNTLEGIRSEALTSGLQSVGEMAEALARFFRYTISNPENLVTLEDELTNVENYFFIQQYRFGQRIRLVVDYDDPEGKQTVLGCYLPKLTLQPVVENAIIHGLERKAGEGCVRIKLGTTRTRLLITVSDDGVGIDEARLAKLIRKLNTLSVEYIKAEGEPQGGIAVLNVNSRIKLLFGEEYGITVCSTPGQGTDVEISLPLAAGDDLRSLQRKWEGVL